MADNTACQCHCGRSFPNNQALGIHRGRSHPLSDQERSRIKQRHNDGATTRMLVQEFCRGAPTLKRVLGEPLPPWGEEILEETLTYTVEVYPPEEMEYPAATAAALVDAFLARVEEARVTIEALTHDYEELFASYETLAEENKTLERKLSLIKTYDSAHLASQLTAAQATLSQPLSIIKPQEDTNA